jgi:hypothetical protein
VGIVVDLGGLVVVGALGVAPVRNGSAEDLLSLLLGSEPEAKSHLEGVQRGVSAKTSVEARLAESGRTIARDG